MSINRSNIDWCDVTINPIIGCSKGCTFRGSQCYAKTLNERFGFIKDFSKPEFFPDRLKDLMNVKADKTTLQRRKEKGWKTKHLDLPLRVFVCSMSDIVGEGIEEKWVKSIIEAMAYNRNVEFMLLTKQPHNYYKYDFPRNVLLGVTIEHAKLYNRALLMPTCNKIRKFVSIEPMLSPFHGCNFSQFEQVIIGGLTGKNKMHPQLDWIKSVEHHNIWLKKNLTH